MDGNDADLPAARRGARGEDGTVSVAIFPGEVQVQNQQERAGSDASRLQEEVERDDVDQHWHDQNEGQWNEAIQ